MNFNELITFGGGINTDDTPQGVPKGDYRDFSYCRLGYNSGNAFAVETSDGTLLVENSSILPQDQILGATPWIKENSIVYFVYKASLIHEIWYYNLDTQLHQVLIQDSVLNFDRDWPIYHANVVEDILKWTDGRWDDQMYEDDGTRLFNPPYQISLRKVLDGFYTVIDLQTIDAIKWPLNAPRVNYISDTTRVDNKLGRKLFRFMVQPIYENGEPGVWSMYSNLALPLESEVVSGGNFLAVTNSNGINITFETGPKIVRKINVAVQEYTPNTFGTLPPFGVFLELDKNIDAVPDNEIYTYVYYGESVLKPLIEPFKNYDRLPVVANCQEYLPTNQIVYTNFREGYNKIDINEIPPGSVLSTNASFELKELNWVPYASQDFLSQWPLGGPGTAYIQQILAYGDWNDFFRYQEKMVFVLQSPGTNSRTYIFQLDLTDINTALLYPTVLDQNLYIFGLIGQSFSQQTGGGGAYTITTIGTGEYRLSWSSSIFATTAPFASGRVRVERQTNSGSSLKVGATHQFGIVYGDRAYRDGTVLTSESMKFYIPWFTELDLEDDYNFNNQESPFRAFPQINIFHQPPVWADRYWIVTKPQTEILSFGQYVICAAGEDPVSISSDGGGRYKLEIDNWYSTFVTGASIQHQIKVGDRVRFIRRKPSITPGDAEDVDYLNTYVEVEVLEYVPASGSSGFASGISPDDPQRDVIYTTTFDPASVQTGVGNLWGQLIEIYTPTPKIDDNGQLFIGVWQDITEAMPILDAHTEFRVHGINFNDFEVFVAEFPSGPPGNYQAYIYGDVTWDVLGYPPNSWKVQIYINDVLTAEDEWSITGATYENAGNRTRLTVPGLVAIDPTMRFFITRDRAQEWDEINNELLLNGTVRPSYGDVYVKQRPYGTGYNVSGDRNYYYYIEDPHYSDFWSSNIHQVGRFRIQDPDAKNKLLSATSIHSGSYIVDTNVNNLSSFSLDSSNIEEMNPTYGGVIRTYMSGREGKTLKCIQPKRENSIYIQYYPNEVGSDSTVRVSGRTFASWFDFKSLFGCENPGATAILPNGAVMYFDNNSGSFIYSGGNGQITVSEIDQNTGKDYKFRTKTKQLAAAYNASSSPVVRTYVNESVGEVGFAFRFDVPYTGIARGRYFPPIANDPKFTILNGDFTYLYNYDIVIVFPESGNAYSGTITEVEYIEPSNYTFITIDGVTPSTQDYARDGYYYTTNNMSYDHVVFDYVNMRWRSTYDYNFQQYCNLGQTLVGWGSNNQMYLHNQPNQWNFHGDSFVQKIKFVSNEQPFMIKRYQDITLISDDLFSVSAESEPNRSYPLGMKTTMPANLISNYEGYGKVNYRKNLYDPRFFNDNNTSTSSYDPPLQPTNGWILGGNQEDLLNENITINQSDTSTGGDGNIYTGVVTFANYDDINDWTVVTLSGHEPGTNGVLGSWYLSERAMVNGEDIRANALTHTLEYNPAINNSSSVLVSVGIKGVLS